MFCLSIIVFLYWCVKVAELTSALSNYKKIVAEKDSKLADYQNQLQNMTGKEDELFKQINEYKDKNNVSTHTLFACQ